MSKTLLICRVCLRTDVKVDSIDEALTGLFDELCDYEGDSFSKFCLECVYELRKFHKFKEKCQLATKTLKNWKKQKPPSSREPLTNLSAKVPSSHRSLSNRKNFKVYSYEAQKLNKVATSDIANSKYPHIVTIDVTKKVIRQYSNKTLKSDITAKVNIECEDDPESPNTVSEDIASKESTIKVKEEDAEEIDNANVTLVFEEVQVDKLIIDPETPDIKKSVVNEEPANENGSDNDADNGFDIKDDLVKENDYGFNDNEVKAEDTSEDEILILKKTKKAKTKRKETRKRKMTLSELAKMDLDANCASDAEDINKDEIVLKKRGRKISLDELRRRLVKQFSHCGEIKDEDGNLINTDVILDSLDTMPMPTLRQLKKQVAAGNGIKILSPATVKMLAHLQKKYSNEYSNVFTVEHLGTRQQILAEFAQRQHYESYVSAQYKCEECFTAFKSYKTLLFHKKASHNEKDTFICTICNVRYSKQASLKWHYFSHRTVYKCKMCPLVTYQKHTMVMHYNIHAGISYNCKKCEATFKSRSGLYLHMNTAHKTQFECATCGRGFSTEYGLKVHLYMAHQEGELETSTCDICDKTFDNYEKYKRHFAYMHSEQMDVMKAKRPRIEKGDRKHGVRNMFCPVCQKHVNTVGAMRWHFKEDHPNESFEVQYSGTHKHLCHECGKGFHAICELNDHKNLHTGEKPYSCAQCGAAFYRKRNLTLHVLRHNPPSKECQLCGKKFRSGSNLHNHMKTHSGERRYKCGICPKAFLHASALSAHTRGVHNHIRRVKKKSTNPIY